MITMLHTPGQQGVEPDAAMIAQLAAMERALFGPEAWSASMLREEFGSPARTYMVDLDDSLQGSDHGAGAVRAYGGFWYDGIDAELMTIGVHAAYQHQGLGSALLDALIEQARLQRAARMLLEVRVDNEPALAMYRRFGFVPLGVRKRYYQPEGVDAYTMALSIGTQREPGARDGCRAHRAGKEHRDHREYRENEEQHAYE